MVRRILLIILGGRNGQFVLLQGTSYGNLLGAFYQKLSMGGNDTSFQGKLKYMLARGHELNYTDIFVGT